ncbi:MAG: transglycosylase SLT domain-containing protein [Gammaproteobacteria bacterium]|nr:MAG: transglycosylase SLT domain-containing protein [Gammaproteobacteria bacterium]
MFWVHLGTIYLAAGLLAGAQAEATDSGHIEAQRAAFRQALPKAQLGDWDGVRPFLDLLADYPLRPDLTAAWLRRKLGPETDAEVARFLGNYPDLGFSADLRYQWAVSLARRAQWLPFLDIYETRYQGRSDTRLHCFAVTGKIALGRTENISEQAGQLWLSAFSQPKECDVVFDYLQDNGLLTTALRRQRISLALERGQIPLARYLAKPLGQPDRDRIDRWVRMRSDPSGQLSDPGRFRDTATDRALIGYGFGRLARRDPPEARELWQEFSGLDFGTNERIRIERDIALAHARRFVPGARSLIEEQASVDPDPIVAQWRVRLALRDLDLPAAGKAIEDLPAEELQRNVWTYWRARAIDEEGDPKEAARLFGKLAAERDYYGFLAADRIGSAYQFGHRPATADEAMIAALEARPDLIRTRELYMTGLYGRGRSEWQAVLKRLSPEQRVQASILAHRWGWHSRAIATASGNGLIDDLDLRFPMPWRNAFDQRSRQSSLEPSFAYGIARSESLFMPDVASSAGAIGLMQLMPATGKQTARQAGIRYRGQQTLMDPEVNIALGTHYLGRMLERFEGNPVLATAAYNAGPHRVSSWLPLDSTLPADIWVDTVPFRETRRYIRRVMMSDTVFDWRFDGDHRRLSDRMPPVRPKIDAGG